MSVRAPDSRSLLTASVSAAMMAKKRTGMGTLDTLGSAPRFNNSFRVFKRTRCLVRQTHNTHNIYKNKQRYTNKIGVIRTQQTLPKKRGQRETELTQFSWQPFCVQSPVCQSAEESPCDSELLLSAASLPL